MEAQRSVQDGNFVSWPQLCVVRVLGLKYTWPDYEKRELHHPALDGCCLS